MEFIDGHPVVNHLVRFQGRAEITEADANEVKDGNTMVWLVRTRCLPPQYHPTAKEAEDRYRFNIQAVESAAPLTGAARDSALLRLNHGQPELWDDDVADLQPEQILAAPDGDDDTHRELVALNNYLEELGERREGERLVNAVARLLEQRRPQAPNVFETRYEDAAFAEAAQIEDTDDVEVLGNVYGSRRNPLADLFEEHFGGDR